MTKDERLHYCGGWLMALPWIFQDPEAGERRIQTIDLFGWNREVKQHDEALTPHQIAEAEAWGKGARSCLGIYPPTPKPPYPA